MSLFKIWTPKVVPITGAGEKGGGGSPNKPFMRPYLGREPPPSLPPSPHEPTPKSNHTQAVLRHSETRRGPLPPVARRPHVLRSRAHALLRGLFGLASEKWGPGRFLVSQDPMPVEMCRGPDPLYT